MPACVIDGVSWDVVGDFGQTGFILDRDHLDDAYLNDREHSMGESIADLLLTASWSWGVTRGLGPLTEPAAGAAVLVMADPERIFDPLGGSDVAAYLKQGLPVRISADGEPVWTGILRSWSHDQGTHESTLGLVDVIGELGMTDADRLASDLASVGATNTGASRVIAFSGWDIGLAGPYAPGSEGSVPDANRAALYWNGTVPAAFARTSDANPAGSILEALAPIRFAEGATLTGSPEGVAWWRGSEAFADPDPTILINCGGVMLASIETTVDHDRIRNQVRIAGHVPEVYISPSSINRNGVHEVSTSVAALALATDAQHVALGLPAGDPYQRWADMILAELAQPHPMIVLGLLRPKGPDEVLPVATARSGDIWQVVHEHVDPIIDREVRVLGQRCSLKPTGLEVDATTEDV